MRRQQGTEGGGTKKGRACPPHADIKMGGGGDPDQQRAPTTQDQQEGKEGERQIGQRGGDGAPPLAGGRGVPSEQARDIVNIIVKYLPGGVPHSGQTPATRTIQHSQQT